MYKRKKIEINVKRAVNNDSVYFNLVIRFKAHFRVQNLLRNSARSGRHVIFLPYKTNADDKQVFVTLCRKLRL